MCERAEIYKLMGRIERDLVKYDISELNSEDYLFKVENTFDVSNSIVKILNYICVEENRSLLIFVPRLKILVTNLQDESYILESGNYHNLNEILAKFKEY